MFATTTDDLEKAFRLDVDDVIIEDGRGDADRLWSVADVSRYMTTAADAVARHTFVLQEVIQLPITPGDRNVDLPAHVLDINAARLVGRNQPVTEMNTNEHTGAAYWDYGNPLPGQSVLTSNVRGVPRTFTRDYALGVLMLTPVPAEGDLLEIQCAVTIDAKLERGMDLPFRDPVDVELMLTHMKASAYVKQDADAQDMVRAAAFADQFRFASIERKAELERIRRRPGAVRMNW